MNSNLAYDEYGHREGVRLERLNGQVYALAQPIFNHNYIAENIRSIFWDYLKGKRCTVLGDGYTLHLPNQSKDGKDYVVPDCMVVCDRSKIKWDGIHGAPDLVLEVLSPSTAKRDRGIKKDIYEKLGVREYWLVSPVEKQLEVYLLQDGHFVLDNVYTVYTERMLTLLDEKERAAIKTEFKCSLFDDLTIHVEDIFADMVED